MIGRERQREGGRCHGASFGVCLLPKAALKARERSAGTSEKGRIRGKHLPRAHGVGPRSLIALDPGRLPDRAPIPTSLTTTKSHRLEKEKSATHVYLSHKVVESLTSLPCLSKAPLLTYSEHRRPRLASPRRVLLITVAEELHNQGRRKRLSLTQRAGIIWFILSGLSDDTIMYFTSSRKLQS